MRHGWPTLPLIHCVCCCSLIFGFQVLYVNYMYGCLSFSFNRFSYQFYSCIFAHVHAYTHTLVQIHDRNSLEILTLLHSKDCTSPVECVDCTEKVVISGSDDYIVRLVISVALLLDFKSLYCLISNAIPRPSLPSHNDRVISVRKAWISLYQCRSCDVAIYIW